MSNTYPWLSYPAQAAIEKIQAEQERGSAKGSVSGKGTGKGKGMTGRSPPSSSYASVVTLKSLRIIMDGYYVCLDRQDMLRWQKGSRLKRKPITELNASCMSTCKALSAAMAKLLAATSKKAMKGKGGGKNTQQSLGQHLFEFAPSDPAREVACMTFDDVKKLTKQEFSSKYASLPLLITLPEEVLAAFAAEKVTASLQAFVHDFTKSEDQDLVSNAASAPIKTTAVPE